MSGYAAAAATSSVSAAYAWAKTINKDAAPSNAGALCDLFCPAAKVCLRGSQGEILLSPRGRKKQLAY